MDERTNKLAERIEKRKQRIETLQSNLKEEKIKLKKDEEALTQLKYDYVLKRMQEKGLSPEDALSAIDNEVEKNQSNSNQ